MGYANLFKKIIKKRVIVAKMLQLTVAKVYQELLPVKPDVILSLGDRER